jgi:protein-S-isoprenylcysteine O-methyltransferase Ste14
MLAQATVWVAASAGVVLLSWRSLGSPRSHGFYRFFAFELLATLIVLNAPSWFRDPRSKRQLFSWFLGAASLGLAIEGFRLLRIAGRPARAPDRSTNLAFENTTALVAVGAYRFIRHPLYASLLGLAWCAGLKNLSAISAGLTVGASGFLVATAVVEERENLQFFGEPYAAYMKTTRRFIPYLF